MEIFIKKKKLRRFVWLKKKRNVGSIATWISLSKKLIRSTRLAQPTLLVKLIVFVSRNFSLLLKFFRSLVKLSPILSLSIYFSLKCNWKDLRKRNQFWACIFFLYVNVCVCRYFGWKWQRVSENKRKANWT